MKSLFIQIIEFNVFITLFLSTTAIDGVIAFTTSPTSIAFQIPTTHVSEGTHLFSTHVTKLSDTLLQGEEIIPTLDLNLDQQYLGTQQHHRKLNIDVEDEEEEHGMPWKVSIAGPEPPLLYMKFWEWQLEFMKENLTNLHVLDCSSEGSASYKHSHNNFSYNENKEKAARIVNLCFASDEYRKIRLTYYDAGEKCQVFNAVWYPHHDQNLPILGIDLLSFNRKKYLAIVDFQPLYQEEELHAVTYEDSILEPIREDYPSLKGKMSSNFYDETQFFSRSMLFSRFDNEEIINDELFPAFQRYVQSHVGLMKATKSSPKHVRPVSERQVEYDTYSAERDPATALFASMFGKEWADEFVYGFLFSQSVKDQSTITIPNNVEDKSPTVTARG